MACTIICAFADSQQNSEFTKTANELIYKSENAFGINQTVRMAKINNCKDYDIITINAFRYACGGSISIAKKEIINSNYANGFIIFAQNPEKYWCFKLNATFDLTLISNHADGLPYVSIVRN